MQGAKGIIRWRGVLLLLILFLLAVLFFALLFKSQLKEVLELELSKRNGAQVKIGSLTLDYVHSYIELHDLQVTDAMQPERDLFEVRTVRAHYNGRMLFHRKILLEQVDVRDIRSGVPRASSGALSSNEMPPEGVPTLLNRVGSNFDADLRRQLEDNPLKHLSELSVGLDIGPKVFDLRSHLETSAYLHQLETDLGNREAQWRHLLVDIPEEWTARAPAETSAPISDGEADEDAKSNEDLSSPPLFSSDDALKTREQVERREAEVQERIKLVKGESTELLKKLDDYSKYVDRDVIVVRKQLGAPKLDSTDLSQSVFSNVILKYLERMSYWLELSRRRMPTGHATVISSMNHRGTSVHFFKEHAFPAILIRRISISSTHTSDPYSTELHGEITGLTSHPGQFGRPAEIALEGDFPAYGIQNLALHLLFDHTGARYREKLSFSLENLPLKDWIFHQSTDLTLRMKSGILGLDVDAKVEENQAMVNWKATFRDVDYTVEAHDTRLNELLQSTLEGIPSFHWQGKLSGPLQHIQLETSSDLGIRLAGSLINGFRYELNAVDENIRSEIIAQLDPQRRDLMARTKEAESRILEALESTSHKLAELKASLSRRS